MAGFSFLPTYQDYLNANPQSQGGSEGGAGTFNGLTEAQWNALPDDQKWNNVGSGVALASSDPRYAAVASQLQGSNFQNGDVIRTGLLSQSNPINSTYYTDPNQVTQGNGVFATGQHNLTPLSQMGNTGGLSDKMWGLAALSLLGGGMAAGSMLGGGAGAGGAAGVSGSSALTTGGFGTDISAGSGAFAGGSAGAAGGAAGAAGSPSDSYWNATAGNNTDVPVGEEGNYAPVTDNSVNASNGVQVVDHSVAANQGLLGNLASGNYQGALGQAGSWIAAHPLQAAGLLQTGYGLVHGNSSGSSSSSSSGNGSKGGSGSSGASNFSVPQQHFYVNPYIAAQIARGYQ